MIKKRRKNKVTHAVVLLGKTKEKNYKKLLMILKIMWMKRKK